MMTEIFAKGDLVLDRVPEVSHQRCLQRGDGAGRRIDTCEVTPVIFTEDGILKTFLLSTVFRRGNHMNWFIGTRHGRCSSASFGS